MSVLHGSNLIAGQESSLGTAKFRSTAPASGEALEPAYAEATPQEIERAVALADSCVEYLTSVPAAQIAGLTKTRIMLLIRVTVAANRRSLGWASRLL